MLAGIRELLLISTPHDQPAFERLLGDGSAWGVSITYASQTEPKGIAEAFLIGEQFLDERPAALVLGDNIFHGARLGELLVEATGKTERASVFAYHVADPRAYGVVEIDAEGRPRQIVEKPANPPSPYAVTGMYFYDRQVCVVASQLRPSARGELEITDLNQWYLQRDLLDVTILPRGTAWLDTGTHDSMLEAGNFIAAIQKRQGYLVGAPEEVAFRAGWIDAAQLRRLAAPLRKSGYGLLLDAVADEAESS